VHGILQVPKTAKNGYFQGAVCDKATAQIEQLRAMGIILRPGRHPKDVPFVSECWLGMYSLGAISPQKQQISVTGAQPYFTRRLGARAYIALSPQTYCNPSSF